MTAMSVVVAAYRRVRSLVFQPWGDTVVAVAARMGLVPRLGGGFVADPGSRLHGFVNSPRVHAGFVQVALVALLVVVFDAVVFGAQGPWEVGVEALCDSFTGIIGQGLSLIAIVIGGLLFAFGEGGSKSQIAGLVFGAGLVLQAPAFLDFVGLTDTDAACDGGTTS